MQRVPLLPEMSHVPCEVMLEYADRIENKQIAWAVRQIVAERRVWAERALAAEAEVTSMRKVAA